MTYCDVAKEKDIHRTYHDDEYGFMQDDETVLFERLLLEIMQAGLSWETILKKRDSFAKSFDQYDVDVVAAYDDNDRQRLLADAGIIRNKLKIDALIHNANVIISMRDSHGGFHRWLLEHHPLTRDEWVKLFKKTFKFTGGEITNEFLMSLGFLPGAHDSSCPVYAQQIERQVPFITAQTAGFNY